MILFFWGPNGQGGGWTVVLSILFPLLLNFLAPLLFDSTSVYVYEEGIGWRRAVADEQQPSASSTGSPSEHQDDVFWPLVVQVILAGVFVLFCFLMLTGRLTGRRYGARRWLFDGPRRTTRPTVTRTHSERIAEVASVVQQLPVEVYHAKEDLNAMSIAELKALLAEANKPTVAIEKSELVDALLAGRNSTAESCAICMEDSYQSGDVLRVLPCGHRFHLECLDTWCFKSTDYSRPTACPVCNMPIRKDLGDYSCEI